MRVYHREFGYRYDSYEFGYTIFGEQEKSDALGGIYSAGFLPHSADPDVRGLFYMARSVRVPLKQSSFTSENRRILKKFDGTCTASMLSREELLADAAFLPCFLSYFAQRHGERVMSEERVRGILATTLPLRGVRYDHEGTLAGYVLEIADDDFVHYWYSCYTSSYAASSFGMWLMLDAVRRAKEEGREYAYLGTAYGAKGRYKTNFEPLQYWDGSAWLENARALKSLIGDAP